MKEPIDIDHISTLCYGVMVIWAMYGLSIGIIWTIQTPLFRANIWTRYGNLFHFLIIGYFTLFIQFECHYAFPLAFKVGHASKAYAMIANCPAGADDEDVMKCGDNSGIFTQVYT